MANALRGVTSCSAISAEEGEFDGGELAAEELRRHGPQQLGDGEVGADDLKGLGRHEGGVDGVAGGTAGEHVEHLLGDVDGNALLRLNGRAGEVGGDDDALLFEQRVLARGLGGEHVEGGPADLARTHGFEQVVLVDDAAASCVHEAHAVLHDGELLARDHAAGGGGERGMHADEVALGIEPVEFDGFRTEGAHALGRHERVVGNDMHLEGEGAAGHLRTDGAEADEARACGRGARRP